MLLHDFGKQIIVVGVSDFALDNFADLGFAVFNISYAVDFRSLSATSSHKGKIGAVAFFFNEHFLDRPDQALVDGVGNGGLFAHDNFCLLYTSPSPRDGLLSRMPS